MVALGHDDGGLSGNPLVFGDERVYLLPAPVINQCAKTLLKNSVWTRTKKALRRRINRRAWFYLCVLLDKLAFFIHLFRCQMLSAGMMRGVQKLMSQVA